MHRGCVLQDIPYTAFVLGIEVSTISHWLPGFSFLTELEVFASTLLDKEVKL